MNFTESIVLFDVGVIDRIMRGAPHDIVAYLIIIAGYSQLYDLRQDTDYIKIWAHGDMGDEHPTWEVRDTQTNHVTMVQWHGFTKGGNMKLRMHNTAYPNRGWHTVLLPIRDFHYVEREYCEHEGTQEASDGHHICSKCGELF